MAEQRRHEATTSIVDVPHSPAPRVTSPRRHSRDLEGTSLVDRYDVESVIGEGGMARVYRGRHKTIHKAVAIKVLDGALDGVPDAVERFLQEAQVTSRVTHENVVEVTDFGIADDGVVFCVMELLVGETLGDLIESSGPLPLPRAASIMRQVCGALQAAHDHGVIHRDLKPDNCFRCPRTSNADFIKVLDFGIARVTDDAHVPANRPVARPRRTEVGCVVGTPDYMAPEQARAEPFDHRVDIYAAGGLFFELLTGRRPYVGNSAAELLGAHVHLAVPDPGELVASLCPEVREVVTTAMAKDPADRYASMGEMAAAIEYAQRAQARWSSGRHRMVRRGSTLVAAAALVLGYWSLGATPVEQPGHALAELASPRLASMIASAPGVIEHAPEPAATPTSISMIATEDPKPVLAEASADQLPPAPPLSRRATRAKRRPLSERAPVEPTTVGAARTAEAPEPRRAAAAEPSSEASPDRGRGPLPGVTDAVDPFEP